MNPQPAVIFDTPRVRVQHNPEPSDLNYGGMCLPSCLTGSWSAWLKPKTLRLQWSQLKRWRTHWDASQVGGPEVVRPSSVRLGLDVGQPPPEGAIPVLSVLRVEGKELKVVTDDLVGEDEELPFVIFQQFRFGEEFKDCVSEFGVGHDFTISE